MKYLLCQIEDLRYAVPVEQIDRIEEPEKGELYSVPSWQSHLRGSSIVEGEVTFGARILLEAQPELLPLYVEEVIDLSVDYTGDVSPFPTEHIDAPAALFSGIILLDELPYIVLSVSGMAKEQNNAPKT